MKLNYFYFTLIIFTLYISACCKKDDEPPVEIPEYPIRLAYAQTSELGMPMLKTFGKADTLANTDFPITRMTQDLVMNNRGAFPDSIVLVSDELCYFDAADGGFLSVQANLDSIPYTLVDDDFEFNLISSNRIITGTGTLTEITIPYHTFTKKGISSSGGGHAPVSYDNFFFTDFFEGDSIVYIRYDVTYRYMQ